MSIKSEDIQENGVRKQIPFLLNTVTISDTEQNTSQLMQRSTNELIVMLRLVRQKRTDFYNYLRVLNKAKGDFQEHAELTGKDYEFWTRKAWVLENILRDRTGSFPERITDDYLAGLAARADKINRKSMRIRTKNRTKS
ncbi:hypothetical protein [Paenibacillus amylolyticus]|nr:hypothetical protein [Paenibacillus amylolyticus]